MQTSTRAVILKIPLPIKDHRIYLAARRILVRLMGAKAPDVIGLIQHNLRGRDATGLADDYLDGVGWPMKAGRTVSLNPRRKVRRIVRSPLIVTSDRLVLPRQRGLVDPTRN